MNTHSQYSLLNNSSWTPVACWVIVQASATLVVPPAPSAHRIVVLTITCDACLGGTLGIHPRQAPPSLRL